MQWFKIEIQSDLQMKFQLIRTHIFYMQYTFAKKKILFKLNSRRNLHNSQTKSPS